MGIQGWGNFKPGDRFGKFTLTEKGPIRYYRNGSGVAQWWCKCDCGETLLVTVDRLKRGEEYKFRCERCMKYRETMYTRASSIIKRCNVPGYREYDNYGGRGIRCMLGVTVSEVADALETIPGFRPDYAIDRIDTNGDYTTYHPIHKYEVYEYIDPVTKHKCLARGNLRWVSTKLNNMNRRSTTNIEYVAKVSRIQALFNKICDDRGWNPNDFSRVRDTKYPFEYRYFYILKDDCKYKYEK